MWAARSNGAAPTLEPSALELCAVAEARFATARALGESALGTSLPAFVGPANTERPVRYAERVLRPWLDRHWARTERLEAAYRRSAEVGCLPWTIAAARAMGDLRLDVAHAIQTIPPPTELADDANTDGCPGEPAWRPLEAAAEAHYRTCLELAVAQGWPSDDSRSCAEALSELNRAGYPAAEELVPTRAFFDEGLGALTPTALLP
jgi:hypothetical protein